MRMMTDFQIAASALIIMFAGAVLIWLQEDMDKRSKGK
jgi:hypothetical protein